MTLDKSLLYHFIKDAIGPYSEDFRFLDKRNPVQFNLNGNIYSAHVSYIHDSGNSRDNEDEVRIQIGRGLIEMQRARFNAGTRVAFLGFFEGGETFVAWDPRHVFSLQAQTVVSVYARQSQLAGVRASQAAVHEFQAKFLQERSFAIALPSEVLGFYLENVERFHRLPTEASIIRLLDQHSSAFADSGLGTGGDLDIEEEGGQRAKFTYERKAYPRDPRFQRWVMEAYGQTCSVCNRQLGLVQAAHIIPHSEDNCPNTVQNGIALCIEHHRLYDDALLLPGPGQQLMFNEERAKYLKQTKQHKGLDEIEALARLGYTVPSQEELRPRDEYLKQGLAIRLA